MPARGERLRRLLRGDGALPIGEALHPATLGAVLVLVLNDWVAKPRVTPGTWAAAVTGKLSDVAGLAAAPVLLTALIGLALAGARRLGAPVDPALTPRRLVAAIVATGAGFAAVKLWPAAAALFVRAVGVLGQATVVADPTDLLCLPALAIAYAVGRDELRRLTSIASPTAARAGRP